MFVDQALADGASAAVVESGRYHRAEGRVIKVADTHEAAARLAASFFGIDRAQGEGRLRLTAVTGTNGKTTVCTLLKSILTSAGLRAASLGTIANDVLGRTERSSMTTLPPVELCRQLSSAVEAGATHAVVEVSSHALDQRRCAGLDFSVAVFTNLTQDHLDYHGDFDTYARVKKRLFDGLGTHWYSSVVTWWLLFVFLVLGLLLTFSGLMFPTG